MAGPSARCALVLALVASLGSASVAGSLGAITPPGASTDSEDEFDLLDHAISAQQKAKSANKGGNILSDLSGIANSAGSADSAKDLFTFNPATQNIEAATEQTLPPSYAPTSTTGQPTGYPTHFPTSMPTNFPSQPPTADVHKVADWFLAPVKGQGGKSKKPETSLSDIFAKFDDKRKKEDEKRRQELKEQAAKEAEQEATKEKARNEKEAKEKALRNYRKTAALRKEADDLLHMSSSNPLLASMSAKLKKEMADVLGTVSEGNRIRQVATSQPTMQPTRNKDIIQDWFFKTVKNPRMAVPTFMPTFAANMYHTSAKEMMDKYLMEDLRKEHIDVDKLSPSLKQKMLGVISDLIAKQENGQMPSANQMWAQTEHVMAKDLLLKGGLKGKQTASGGGASAGAQPKSTLQRPEQLLMQAKQKALRTEDKLMSDIFATKAGEKISCDVKLANVPDNHKHQCKLIALAKSHFIIPTEMKRTLHGYLEHPTQNSKVISRMKDILDSSLPGNRQVQELQKLVTSAEIQKAVPKRTPAQLAAAGKRLELQKKELEVLGKTVAPTAAPTMPSAPISRVANWFQTEAQDIERSLPTLQTLLQAKPTERLADMDKFDHAAWFHSKVEHALQSENQKTGKIDWFGHSKKAGTPSWYLNEKKHGVPRWLKPSSSPTVSASSSAPTLAPTDESMYTTFAKNKAKSATPVPTPSSWKDQGFLGELKAIEAQRKKIREANSQRTAPPSTGPTFPPTIGPTHMVLPPQTKENMVQWAKALLRRFPHGLHTHAPTVYPTSVPTFVTVAPTPAPTPPPTPVPTVQAIHIPRDKYGNIDETAVQKDGYLSKFDQDIAAISKREKATGTMPIIHKKVQKPKKPAKKHRKKAAEKRKKSSAPYNPAEITSLPQAPKSIYADDDAGDDDADDDDKSASPAVQELNAKQQILNEFKRAINRPAAGTYNDMTP